MGTHIVRFSLSRQCAAVEVVFDVVPPFGNQPYSRGVADSGGDGASDGIVGLPPNVRIVFVAGLSSSNINGQAVVLLKLIKQLTQRTTPPLFSCKVIGIKTPPQLGSPPEPPSLLMSMVHEGAGCV